MVVRLRAVGRFLFDNWFAIPALVLLLVFKGAPFVLGVVNSLTVKPGTYGLANYTRMLHDDRWLAAVGNLASMFLVLPILVMLPLGIAFILAELGRVRSSRTASFLRSVVLLSYLLPPLMVGLMFSYILKLDGPLNVGLSAAGLGGLATDWLGQQGTALWAVLAVVVWCWYGLGVVIYLAGLSQVPGEQVDAARVDGASGSALFVHIVIPNLRPTIAYWTVLCSASLIVGLFGYVYALTGGGPGYATVVPELYVWQVSSKFIEPGYAAALGVVLFAVLTIVALFQVRLLYTRASER